MERAIKNTTSPKLKMKEFEIKITLNFRSS
jgi:hypothetical protein